MSILNDYALHQGCYDEVFDDSGALRPPYKVLEQRLNAISPAEFQSLNEKAKLSFLNQGITYALYTASESTETIFPFDLVPRILSHDEWLGLERGLIQRNQALNLFIEDVYHGRKIFRDGVVPEHLVLSSRHFVPLMQNFRPPGGIYIHICGTDLIRHADGRFYVLEDNLRSPSGVSYVLSNRVTLSRTLPQWFQGNVVYPVAQYPTELHRALAAVSDAKDAKSRCVLLTPGQYNSAYYEHSFLARMMGIDLVEGSDLFVDQDFVYMNTIGRKERVDVIYRRIDDQFLDPKHFRPESVLGVPGLMDAYLKGNVAIANAVGTGISDDKAVCAYVPDMIRYYLGQEPVIPNVPTYICERPDDLRYVLEHLSELVVKPVDMSGGYGVTIADTLTKDELETLKHQIKDNPREYIAQPKMMLSTHFTFIEEERVFEPRHIDLRTFTLMRPDKTYVLPGGLSRVALRRGSLIVNSSQGGGSKDTWVIMNSSSKA